MLKRIVLIGLGFCVVGLAGCPELQTLRRANANLKSQLASVTGERDELAETNKSLLAQLDTSQAALAESKAESRRMTQVINELKAEQDRKNRQTAELKTLLGNVAGISVEARGEGNFIVMESEILFDPGQIDLKPQVQASLNKIAGYLTSNPDLHVRIDGHTDGVPIQLSPWKSNYHLGAMRALAVMEYLEGKGVTPDRMYIVGFGPNRPRVPPQRPTEPVAANRRVEILVVPKGIRTPAQIIEGLRS